MNAKMQHKAQQIEKRLRANFNKCMYFEVYHDGRSFVMYVEGWRKELEPVNFYYGDGIHAYKLFDEMAKDALDYKIEHHKLDSIDLKKIAERYPELAKK
jgi:hypothetical protein